MPLLSLLFQAGRFTFNELMVAFHAVPIILPGGRRIDIGWSSKVQQPISQILLTEHCVMCTLCCVCSVLLANIAWTCKVKQPLMLILLAEHCVQRALCCVCCFSPANIAWTSKVEQASKQNL